MKSPENSQIKLPFHTLDSLRARIGWFINLRWIAVFGILSAIPVGQQVFAFNLAYNQIYVVIAVLVILNIFYLYLYKYFPFRNFSQELAFTEIQLIIDLFIISFLVHYIGGINNPFFFLYIVHIIISGILFQKVIPYINALLAAGLLTTWSILEYFGIVDVYLISAEQLTLSILVTSLCAFYLLIFSTTYIIKDFITRYRYLKSLIDHKSELLEKTMLERDKMFQFTAHELKAPLTTLRSVLGVIKMLYSQEEQQPKITEMLGRAERRSDQILHMVKDMIDITHYKHGKKKIQAETVDFNKWIQEKVESLKDYATKENIELVIKKLQESPEVSFDTVGLEKVVINLINNAIRYNEKGGKITVIPFVNENRFGFKVKDDGIGIAPEDQDKIFNDFYRGKNARQKEQIGTGLGLSLVKQIVAQAGGQIDVQSELQVGSEFRVKLPLGQSDERHQ